MFLGNNQAVKVYIHLLFCLLNQLLNHGFGTKVVGFWNLLSLLLFLFICM